MTFTWRYAILAAVSSEEQVKTTSGETKKSLEYQAETARIWGDRHGGTYTDTYRAEGFSRTGWFDFTKALEACAEFDRLARDARAHKFDVILMESYDRLGDLAVMWFIYLEREIGAPYIQLRSVQKPLIIEEPAIYDPRYDESTPDALNDAQKINRYRINKLRRGGQVGIPQRAKDGKYSTHLPRFYKFTGTKKEYKVELDPVAKSLLIDMKDKYLLHGWSLAELEQYAESIYPIGWRRSFIKEVFRNPFYAGKTFHTRGGTNASGTWSPKPDDEVTLYDGLHEPVWDYDTYLQLKAEIERRGKHLRHKRAYPLTGLVVCEACDRHMHITPARNQNYQHYTYYRCRGCELNVREHVVTEEFVKSLRAKMSGFSDAPLNADQPDLVDNSRAIAALRKQLYKIRVAYETTDSYTADEYAERKREINAEIAKLEDAVYQREKQIREIRQQQDALLFVRQLLPGIEIWIENTPPNEVNIALSRAVVKVGVRQDKTINVVLR